MDPHAIPPRLRSLVQVQGVGCTGVTLSAVDALLEIADAPVLLQRCVAFLTAQLPGYATLWHLANALRTDDARPALRRFSQQLRDNADKSIAATVALLAARREAVEMAPSSSLARQVVARLGGADDDRAAKVGLAGADAVGPDDVLNIVGTRDLAARMPTVVVTTSSRLVPRQVFARLGSPLFERIPLDWFEFVVIDGEALRPAETRRRISALGQA
jgi:hypothetical protein